MMDVRELLAEIEHIQWAHWTEYMLDNLNEKNITRWRSQIKTEYKDLTEKEKDSDRVWANKVIEAITKHNYKQAFGSSNLKRKSQDE